MFSVRFIDHESGNENRGACGRIMRNNSQILQRNNRFISMTTVIDLILNLLKSVRLSN